MNKFQIGDVVRCLRDRPFGARILRGEEAIITEIISGAHINFKTRTGYSHFAGSPYDFALVEQEICENE